MASPSGALLFVLLHRTFTGHAQGCPGAPGSHASSHPCAQIPCAKLQNTVKRCHSPDTSDRVSFGTFWGGNEQGQDMTAPGTVLQGVLAGPCSGCWTVPRTKPPQGGEQGTRRPPRTAMDQVGVHCTPSNGIVPVSRSLSRSLGGLGFLAEAAGWIGTSGQAASHTRQPAGGKSQGRAVFRLFPCWSYDAPHFTWPLKVHVSYN